MMHIDFMMTDWSFKIALEKLKNQGKNWSLSELQNECQNQEKVLEIDQNW